MATIASIIKDGIAAGKNTAEILEMVKHQKPEANTSAACVAYYRSKMKKEVKAVTSNDDKMAKIGESIIAQAKAKTVKPSEAAEARAKLIAAVAKQTATAMGSSDPVYTVKNLKTFTGMEGSGYNATLYRDGKAVAAIIDDASGGPLIVDWKDFKGGSNFVEVSGYDYSGELRIYNGTPEEKILMDFINKMEPYMCEYSNKSTRWTHDVYLDEMVNEALFINKIRKACQKRVVFVDGKTQQIQSVKALPSEANIIAITKKFGPLTILNGLSDDKFIAAVKAAKK